MAAHLSALVAIAGLPFGHVLGPLIVYLVKGHESEFVAEHARASLNYQITVSLFAVVAILIAAVLALSVLVPMTASSDSTTAGVALGGLWLVFWVTFGIAALSVLVGSIVLIVLGTIAASEGRPYEYPFAIRFLR